VDVDKDSEWCRPLTKDEAEKLKDFHFAGPLGFVGGNRDWLEAMANSKDVSKDELQHDFNEDSGISPLEIKVVMSILFLIFLCITCPIIYMMRSSNSGLTAAFKKQVKKSTIA